MWDGAKITLALLAAATFSTHALARQQPSPSLDDLTAAIDTAGVDFSFDFSDGHSDLDHYDTTSAATQPASGGTDQPSIEPLDTHDPFAEGVWNWNIYGEVGFGSDVGELYAAHFGAGYNLAEGFSIGFDGAFIYADMHRDDSQDAVGGQLDCQLRWHVFRGEDWSLFADFTGGFVLFSREFPRYGSNLNFMWQFGVGGTYKLCEEVWLLGGVRWTHISNGNFLEGDENPGYDGIHIWLGVMMPF